MTEKPAKVTYCGTCRRIKGVGCACGLTFAEKIKSVAATVPDNMRAVPRSNR